MRNNVPAIYDHFQVSLILDVFQGDKIPLEGCSWREGLWESSKAMSSMLLWLLIGQNNRRCALIGTFPDYSLQHLFQIDPFNLTFDFSWLTYYTEEAFQSVAAGSRGKN